MQGPFKTSKDCKRCRLQAIVDKLPKMADGVPMISANDPHYICDDGTIVKITGWYVWHDGVWGIRISDPTLGRLVFVMTEEKAKRVYSTRKAAETAEAIPTPPPDSPLRDAGPGV